MKKSILFRWMKCSLTGNNIRQTKHYLVCLMVIALCTVALSTCTNPIVITEIAVTGVSLSQTTLSITEGDKISLTASITPLDLTDIKITWSSENSLVATVDNTGKVTAVKEGAATITIPNSVTSIGPFAFPGSLNEIHIKNPIPLVFAALDPNSDPFIHVDRQTCKLYVPTGAKSAYLAVNVWKYFVNIIEE